ncbi:MAG: IS1595 family transposase [Dehalococcoidia bacterium]
MQKYTIHDFNRDFPDEESCLDLVADLIYPDGMPCRKCGELRKHHRLTNRKAFSCQICGTHIYPLAGTIFAKSTTPLKSWFYAMYLIASTRCGISAKQLERELGVTYKTAWRIYNQLRKLMAENSGPLTGTVEVDETWIGGKPRYRAGGPQPARRADGSRRPGRRTRAEAPNQKPVIGMVERGGRVRAFAVPHVGRRVAQPLVQAHVMPASLVYTDAANAYDLLEGKGYRHERIHHEAKVYVDGDIHTNTIEGFWSLLKNGIAGVYHSVSAKHLQAYVNEYAFRYNHRKSDAPMYELVKAQVKAVRYGRYGAYAPIGE